MSTETGAFGGCTQVSVPARAGAAHAGRLAACLVAATALQAGAWQLAAGVIGRETVGAGTVPPPPGPPTVRLRTIAPAPAATANASTAPTTDPSEPAAAPPPPPPPPPPVAPTRASPDPDGSLATQRPFYEYREVDIPAEPVGEWNLDASTLAALATSRIVFTLFVGSDGTLLHCRVDEPERLTAAARHGIEARLCDTAMRPARRGGMAVASRRRVELFIDGG